MRFRGHRTAVVATVALLMFAAGCSSVQRLSFPTPPSTQAHATAAPTLPDNLSSVNQQPVAGVTTTTLPRVGPGAAVLNGSVFGPSGPVGGATVEADRLVGDQVATVRTVTAADGSWKITHILGGVYRVRAWHAPNLDVTTPQVLFVGDVEALTVSLQLTSFPGPNVATSMAPTVPYVGRAANLLVQVTNPTISTDGVLTYQPVAGDKVQLTPGSGWTVSGPNPSTTNTAGNVVFQVECRAAGAAPLIATIGAKGAPVALPVPNCAPVPGSTTSTTAPCPTTTVAPPAFSSGPTVPPGKC
jgi:hypothetical protein